MPPLTHSVARPRELCIPLEHLVQQRHRDPRSGAADGMAERDGTAIDVELVAVEMQFAVAGQNLRGEGFIQLDQFEVGELQAVFSFEFAAARERGRCP